MSISIFSHRLSILPMYVRAQSLVFGVQAAPDHFRSGRAVIAPRAP